MKTRLLRANQAPTKTTLANKMVEIKLARQQAARKAQEALYAAQIDAQEAIRGLNELDQRVGVRSAFTDDGQEATRLEIVAAHELVVNQADRRGPINTLIAVELQEIISDAIGFFDATPATFTLAGKDTLRVTSIGYRAGPAGDH